MLHHDIKPPSQRQHSGDRLGAEDGRRGEGRRAQGGPHPRAGALVGVDPGDRAASRRTTRRSSGSGTSGTTWCRHRSRRREPWRPAAFPGRFDINGDGDAVAIDEEELEQLKALGYVPDNADRGRRPVRLPSHQRDRLPPKARSDRGQRALCRRDLDPRPLDLDAKKPAVLPGDALDAAGSSSTAGAIRGSMVEAPRPTSSSSRCTTCSGSLTDWKNAGNLTRLQQRRRTRRRRLVVGRRDRSPGR